MILVRIIKSYRDTVAICDSNLLGKRFVSRASEDPTETSEKGKFQLDIKKSFFGGEETSEENTIEIMKEMVSEDAIFYIVGEKSVNTAIKAGIISEDGFGEIGGVKFALELL